MGSSLACKTCDCLHSLSRSRIPQAELDSFTFIFFMALCQVLAVLMALVLLTAETSFFPFLPSLTLETADTKIPDLASHFTVQPQKGLLAASDRPVQVQVLFHPKVEINIEDKPILHCQVSCLGQVVLAHQVLGV